MSRQFQGYAIWQTRASIELSVATKPQKQASLICKCRNYQSALRVAGELAEQLRLPLIMSLSSSSCINYRRPTY